MAMTFDATLKNMGRESPRDFLATFDRAPAGPVSLLNVDLSTVTTATDLTIGVGEPLAEIIHIEFQSSAAAWKHADLLVYNALLFAHRHVPVHTVIILLRPGAAHANLNGAIEYAPRPARGRMSFSYEIVRLWERPAVELLAADIGVVPLAVLGRLPEQLSLEDGLRAVAERVAERLINEVPPERAKRLLTEALLLAGLRVRRDIAVRIFRGVRIMHESDTYLMILEEGEEKATRELILLQGEDRFGPPDESVKAALTDVSDLNRLKRMARQTPKATSWQALLQTP